MLLSDLDEKNKEAETYTLENLEHGRFMSYGEKTGELKLSKD